MPLWDAVWCFSDTTPQEVLRLRWRAGEQCQALSCGASRAQLRRTAIKLKGVQYLALASPKCYVHHAGGGCAALGDNKETGLMMGGCGERGGGPKVGWCKLNPCLKAFESAWFPLLKLKYDEPSSDCGFDCNLRCPYTEAGCDMGAGFEDRVPMPEGDGFKGRKKYGRCAVGPYTFVHLWARPEHSSTFGINLGT